MRFAYLLALAAFCLTGCAGYHIGPIQPKFMSGIKTIAVPTFRNDTLYPRIEVLVADRVIKQLQEDGTYRVDTEDRADATLEGTIKRIERRPSRSLVGNTFATEEFTLTVFVSFSLRKRGSTAVLDQRLIAGQTSFFVSSDVNQEERQAMPLAIQDAAVHLVTALSEGW